MNKKILPILLAFSMLSQSVIISSALDSNNTPTNADSDIIENSNVVDEKEKETSVNKPNNEVNPSNITEPETVNKEEEKKEDVVEPEKDKNTLPHLESELYAFKNSDSIVKRISSSERVKTSIEISKFQNVTAKKVILADSRNYPDALAAAGLTDGKYPVLLVGSDITIELINEIKRLQAEEIIILGGNNSISTAIENKLNSIEGIKTKRISGYNRYETSKKILEESGKNSVVFAYGRNFPDALAASPLLKKSALLLTNKYSLSPELSDTVKNITDKNVQIIGGIGSISKSFENQITNTYGIENIERISGIDRYTTSVKVAEKFQSDTAIIASGESFPDALASSTLAQMIDAPVLLVSKNKIDESVANYIKNNNIKKAIIVGGEGTISKTTETNVERLIQGKDMIVPQTPIIPSVEFDKNDKNAVTKSDVNVYTDKDMNNVLGTVKNNKIIDILEYTETSTKVQYDKLVGWVNNEQLTKYNPVSFGKVVNQVPYVSQLYPVYAPNGCEPTAMLMGLQGKGYTNIGLRAFLDAMPKTSSNPQKGYVGSPYGNENTRFLTIDPEPLAKYGQKYGNVANIQGQPIDQIIKEIQNGNTVVVYLTLYWGTPKYKVLPIDGVPTRRIFNNHALLLTGYDPAKKMFYIADPYNHEKSGANRKKSFYYWKAQSEVERCYNYDNRRFAVSIR
ncbi:cell wall-binding repeat-containing protein [Peptostreptococcus faecalis]|uniref:cell wall-binding repeat-containing protein n=1 Tax=Peptostreptococcus faecalis TaxID=2045015 RepID=UPI000C7B514D|nr:cell wall-binding repeat-containing protein [Peptostreptococcus faecalis]